MSTTFQAYPLEADWSKQLLNKVIIKATELQTRSNENDEPSPIVFSRNTNLPAYKVVCFFPALQEEEHYGSPASEVHENWPNREHSTSIGFQCNLDPAQKWILMGVEAHPACNIRLF